MTAVVTVNTIDRQRTSFHGLRSLAAACTSALPAYPSCIKLPSLKNSTESTKGYNDYQSEICRPTRGVGQDEEGKKLHFVILCACMI